MLSKEERLKKRKLQQTNKPCAKKKALKKSKSKIHSKALQKRKFSRLAYNLKLGKGKASAKKKAARRTKEKTQVRNLQRRLGVQAVSYTHLTLPTNREV